MPTGPGHYLEAERLTAQASAYEGLPSNAHIQDGQLAQVHATLALVDVIDTLDTFLRTALDR